MLKTSHSKHCLIQGVTFKDSPNHNLVMYCDYMEADHVTLLAPPSCEGCPSDGGKPSHNTDGIDVYGSPAYIHHCHIDLGDDNMAAHGNDLLVENSYIGHGHGLTIGSVHSNAGVQNITFRNIIMNRTDCALRIKTDAGAKNCHVKNVTHENITTYDAHNTISIDMFYDGGHGKKNETTDCPISDIKIINVTAHGNKDPEGKKKGQDSRWARSTARSLARATEFSWRTSCMWINWINITIRFNVMKRTAHGTTSHLRLKALSMTKLARTDARVVAAQPTCMSRASSSYRNRVYKRRFAELGCDELGHHNLHWQC